MNTCQGCGSAERDVLLCNACTKALVTDIATVAVRQRDVEGRLASTLLDELDLATARQVRIAVVLGRRNSDEQPLPVNLQASSLARSIRVALRRSARLVGWAPVTRCETADWLLDHLKELRLSTEGGALLKELDRLIEAGYAAIDRPESRWYAGTCTATCPGDLWVVPDSPYVQCPVCRRRHDVAERKTLLLQVVEDSLATATEIGRAGNLFDRQVTPATIWRLASRKRITARGLSSRGEPMYRIGDVLSVLREKG